MDSSAIELGYRGKRQGAYFWDLKAQVADYLDGRDGRLGGLDRCRRRLRRLLRRCAVRPGRAGLVPGALRPGPDRAPLPGGGHARGQEKGQGAEGRRCAHAGPAVASISCPSCGAAWGPRGEHR